MRIFSTACAVVICAASSISAQDLPGAKELAKQLFKTGKNKTVVRILHPELVPSQFTDAMQAAAKVQHFYEAMAVSPDEGMLANSATHAVNHHSAAAAHTAALTACNAQKKKASEPCVVMAEFLPKGYEGPRAFSLSYNATEVFAKKYKRAGKPKAFAVSATTGHWGQAVKADSSQEARSIALADCAVKAAKAGGEDCVIVSEN